MDIFNINIIFKKGVNGTFRLSLEGDGGVFEITPSEGINHVSFLIRVKNAGRLDFEKTKGILTNLLRIEMRTYQPKTLKYFFQN